MKKITSIDGTPIAYQQSGAGAPLVLVHGTSASHVRWNPLLPALNQTFTVYAIDRRGRGESGDAVQYAIEREFEDVAAVVNSIPGPVNLLGHSFGAICSLEAALRTTNIRRLILYEPPIPTEGVTIYPSGVIERVQDRLDSGDRAGTVNTFLREVVHMPPAELALMQASPVWKERVAAAHTLPRELRAGENYHFNKERFTKLIVPTLLLLGGDSPNYFKAAIDAVHTALPNSQVVILPGQQHVAIDTATELFQREVITFLKE